MQSPSKASAVLPAGWLVLSLVAAACSPPSPGGPTGSGGHTGSTTSAGSTTSTGSTSSSGGSLCNCGSGYVCDDQVFPPLCGMQCSFTNGCQTDAACQDAGTGLVCDTACSCQFGLPAARGPACIKGCATNPDCGPSMVCSATHHCLPAPCAKATDCTANFTCASDASGMHCAPKPCTKDTDCGNYCVEGSCSPQQATCVVIP